MKRPRPGLGWRLVGAIFPALMGGFGLFNGLGDWQHSTTLAQKISSLGIIVYGPLGIAAAVLILLEKPVGRTVLVAFSAVVSLVAGVAPVAWGDAPPMFGVLSGFSAALLCGAAIWATTHGFVLDAAKPTDG